MKHSRTLKTIIQKVQGYKLFKNVMDISANIFILILAIFICVIIFRKIIILTKTQ